MAGKYITPLSYKAMSERDVKNLYKLCKVDYYGIKPEEIVAEVIKKDKQLWRFKATKAQGIIVTNLVKHGSAHELWIAGIAGFGYRRIMQELLKELLVYFQPFNVRWVSSNVRDGMGEKYIKLHEDMLGAKRRAVTCSLDLTER